MRRCDVGTRSKSRLHTRWFACEKKQKPKGQGGDSGGAAPEGLKVEKGMPAEATHNCFGMGLGMVMSGREGLGHGCGWGRSHDTV